MKRILIIIVAILVLALAAWVFMALRSQRGSDGADEAAIRPLTAEELVDAAEKLKAPAPSQAEIAEAEAAAEALAGTSTSGTMSSKEQEELIKAAEALKANN